LACAAAIEKAVAQGMAVDADGVERARDVGKDIFAMDESGVDAEGDG